MCNQGTRKYIYMEQEMEALDPQTQEQTYVHTVYNEIATHFSQTRYKPWPIVEEFLQGRTKGQVGIDVGCGNGKYLGVNKDVYIVGSDRSDGLVDCAREFGHEVMCADGLSLPHPQGRFDFAISIAVIHHFSTPQRRTQAIEHMLSKLKPGGELLVYVWALEQEKSRRGYKEGDDQDVLVPWVLQQKQPKKPKKVKQRRRAHDDAQMVDEQPVDEQPQPQPQPQTKYRYYHLYKQGELEQNAADAGGKVLRHGYEKDNWYCVIQRPPADL